MAYRHGEGAQKMGMGPSSKDTNQFNQNPVQNQSCFDLSLTVIRSATNYILMPVCQCEADQTSAGLAP